MKIPKNEKPVTTFLSMTKEPEYVITQSITDSTSFTFYKVEDGRLVKIKKSKSPLEFHELWRNEKIKKGEI